MRATFNYTREEVHAAILSYHDKRFTPKEKVYVSKVVPCDGDGAMTVLVHEVPKDQQVTPWQVLRGKVQALKQRLI
jgi:hypothetical protein